MIRAAVIGATGYVGEELARLLLMHPEVEVVALASKTYAGEKFSSIYRNFLDRTDLTLVEPDIEKIAPESDVIFLALPHGLASRFVTKEILKNTVIIDMGADFRIKDVKTYETWYATTHESPKLLENAVYGLPEYYREKIKHANLIANPGCYPTAALTALLPLIRQGLIDPTSIIIDAASGVTGAGRSAKTDYSYCYVDENYRAYGVGGHRHQPEIEGILDVFSEKASNIIFTPHLLPMQRGILETIYARTDNSEEEIDSAYRRAYRDEYFIRYLGHEMPETKYVKGSNYVDVGFHYDKKTGRVILVSAIDNLMKGAASQAIQNMNIRFGIEETQGIAMLPDLPI